MIEVRNAIHADVDALLTVGRQAWRSTYVPLVGEQYVQDFLDRWWTADGLRSAIDAGHVWAGCLNGEVAGMASYSIKALVLTVHRLYVAPARQGQGVGTALVERIVEVERPNADRIALAFMAGNDAAGRFYERLGFTETHREPDPAGGPDDVWLTRSIEAR